MHEDPTLPAPGAPDDATRLAPAGQTARLPHDEALAEPDLEPLRAEARYEALVTRVSSRPPAG